MLRPIASVHAGGSVLCSSGDLQSGSRALARALAGKLLTYATGGAPTTADRPEVEAIVGKVRVKDYGFRAMVHEIVQSKMFQSKQGS